MDEARSNHDGPHLAARTRGKVRHDLNRFRRFCGEVAIGEITTELFIGFRKAALAAGLTARTIEDTISTVLAVLRSLPKESMSEVPKAGKRLRIAPSVPVVPELDRLNRVMEACDENWWLFYAVAYFTAARLSDLRALEWSRVGDDWIQFVAEKTGKVHRIPVHPALRRLLAARGEGRLFITCPKALRFRLRQAAKAAGVPVVLPQHVRRLSATQYEKAHPGAGRLILGHSLPGATQFYLRPEDVLVEASRKIQVPDCLKAPGEADARVAREEALVRRWRDMPAGEQEAVERVVLAMAGKQ